MGREGTPWQSHVFLCHLQLPQEAVLGSTPPPKPQQSTAAPRGSSSPQAVLSGVRLSARALLPA